MTKRLYYTDSYRTDFEAGVIDKLTVEGRPAVVLDQTYFYPTGGGQPHDIGHVNESPVLDVITRPEDGAVVHVIETLPSANLVVGEVDWARRFDHMQHHTGQHILSRAFIEVINAETIGFHLSENSVTIDLDCAEVPTTDLDAVENLANQIIAENRPVHAWFPEPEELETLPLRKISEKVTGAVRVVNVGDFDICACGGTHVAYTGEIGLIKVVKLERARKNVRVEFRCGQRGLEDYRQKNDILLGLASSMTVGYWEVSDAVERLREDNKSLQRELKAASGRLLQYEAAELWDAARQADPEAKFVFVGEIWDDRAVGDLQGLVRYLTERPGTITALMLAAEKAHVILGTSDDTGYDVVPVLKAALETLGTSRGGGRPTLAQGGGFPATRSQLEPVLEYIRNRVARGE